MTEQDSCGNSSTHITTSKQAGIEETDKIVLKQVQVAGKWLKIMTFKLPFKVVFPYPQIILEILC